MPRAVGERGVATLVLALLLGGARTSRADPVDEKACTAAYEDAQLLRRSGKLIAAREAAMTCARPACPDVVRGDCASWAGEIAKLVPSIVVIARAAGGDAGHAPGARVRVDGVERAEASSGRAFEVDPGAHVVRVERAGDLPIEESVTVFQGERDRVLRFELRPAEAPRPVDPAPRRSYVPAIAVAGVAAVALGASAWLGLSGRGELSDLRATCAPSCTDAEVDPVRRKLVASDVLLGAGVVAAGLSLYLFARPPTVAARASAFVRLVPMGGGAVFAVGAAR
jgi:hypothetical protein